MIQEIRLGLPKGSLNTIGRAVTQEVLLDAGYDVQGYEPGKESDSRLSMANDPEIRPFLVRPQSAPVELSRELLDIAITGKDWIEEENVNGNQNGIRKIGDLEYGQTRLVIAIPTNSSSVSLSDFFLSLRERKKPILCFTEYVNLTRRKFLQNEAYQAIFGDKRPLVQIRGLVDGENPFVQILNSDGVTEGYIAKGADIIADNTQKGDTLKSYGLRELEEIMKSSAGLYAGSSCVGWKEEKALKIYQQLYGAVFAKRYFFILFNVPPSQRPGATDYLISEGLCSKEPSVVPGTDYDQVNTLLPRDRYPEALQTLMDKFGACDIVRLDGKQYIGR